MRNCRIIPLAIFVFAGCFLAALQSGCAKQSDSSWTIGRSRSGSPPAPSSTEHKGKSRETNRATGGGHKSARSGLAESDSVPAAEHSTLKTQPPIVLKPRPDPKPGSGSPLIADFQLTERSGRIIRRDDLKGQPWVACFIFTHCAGPCSDVSAQMSFLQEWLQKTDTKVRLVTFTVDPQRDTPEVLRRYADNFGADKDRWLFLTGDKQRIYRLIRESFRQTVYELTGKDRKPGWEVAHSTSLVLVDEHCRVVETFIARDPVSMATLKQRLQQWKRTGSFKTKKTNTTPKAAK